MKVYLVTSGCYSDYSVDAVFSTREKAEAYIENYNERSIYDGDFNEIKEYDMDAPLETHKILYSVRFGKAEVRYVDSNVECEGLVEGHAYVYSDCNAHNVLVWSDSAEKAKAIAIERYNAWRAVVDTHTPLVNVANVISDTKYCHNVYGHMYDLNTYEDVSLKAFKNARIEENEISIYNF